MNGERFSAAELIEKEQAEQAEFLVDIANKLNAAGFPWDVFDRYMALFDNMVYRGLIVANDQRLHRVTILAPNGKILLLERGKGKVGELTPLEILEASGRGFLQVVENSAASALTSLREQKVRA